MRPTENKSKKKRAIVIFFGFLLLVLYFQNCGNIHLTGNTSNSSSTAECSDLAASRPENIYEDTSNDPSTVTFQMNERDNSQALYRSQRIFDWYIDGILQSSGSSLSAPLTNFKFCESKLIESKLTVCGNLMAWKKSYIKADSTCVQPVPTPTPTPAPAPAPTPTPISGTACTPDILKMYDYINSISDSFARIIMPNRTLSAAEVGLYIKSFRNMRMPIGHSNYKLVIEVLPGETTSVTSIKPNILFGPEDISTGLINFSVSLSKNCADFSSSSQILTASASNAQFKTVDDATVLPRSLVFTEPGIWYLNIAADCAENAMGWCQWSLFYKAGKF